jgi:glycosyltransferase involved in cell wall biosynthesis
MTAANSSTARRDDAIDSWLFVDGATHFGGHEVMLLRLIEELKAQGRVRPRLLARTATVLRAKAGDMATDAPLPAQPPSYRVSFRPKALLLHLRDARSLVRTLRRERPTLCIVAEGCLLSQPLFALVARLAGAKVVIYVPLVDSASSMGFGSGRQRDAFVRRVYANWPAAWITITRQQAQSFRAWAGIRRPILTLPNTVASEIESAESPCSVDPRSDAPLRVLVLGRLEPWQKGLDFLVSHLESIAASPARIRITLVGDGDYAIDVQARLQAVAPMREWLSVEPWSETRSVMRANDVLLLPSRFEGVPLVMLEAMALGLPVVASDLAGTRGYLPPECLFPVGDMPRALALIERLRDPAVRSALIARNREAYARMASNAAFATAVSALTAQLVAIGNARTSVEIADRWQADAGE